MSGRFWSLLAGVVVAGAACAPKTVTYDPFKLPRDEFYGSLKVVALAPVGAPSDIEDRDAVRARFAALIEARLREAGFEVVPPSETGPIWDAAAAGKGGLYDPTTGKFDKAKFEAVEREALAALRDRFRADALLTPSLRVVRARLQADTAYWDGTSEAAGTGFWKAFFVGTHSGHIPALSLVVWLTRSDGTDLYSNAGGIRVLGVVDRKGQLVAKAQGDLLADEVRNARAVALALGPLLGIAPPPE